MTTADVLLPLGLALGEGVVPLAADGEFAFVDIRSARVFRGSLNGDHEMVLAASGSVGAVAPTTSGDLLIAERRRLRLLSGRASVDVPSRSDVRTNDGGTDPAGRYLIGTMADPPRAGVGALWSFAGGPPSCLVSDVTISNGLCWAADGATMYYIDTPTQSVDAFDYDVATGEVGNRRRHLTIDAANGAPDGMTIDAEGGLWVALWGGYAVHRYVGSRLDRVVDVPTPYVTCPALVGDRLVITTAAEPARNDPMAGHVFVAEIDGGSPTQHLVDDALVFPT